MASGPGGKEVGRVSVRVVPDTSDFRRELKAQLERLERQLNGEIPFEADTSAMQEQVERAARDAATKAEQKVKFGVDSSGLTAAARAFNDIIDSSNLDRISISMNRFERIMANTIVNATRLRSALERSTRTVVNLTRSAFNVRQHFQSLSQAVNTLNGHIGRIRFAGINRDVDRSSNLFRRFGRVAVRSVNNVRRGIGRGLLRAFSSVRRIGTNAFTGVSSSLRGLATGLQTAGTSALSVLGSILRLSAAAFAISVAGAGITAAWAAAATAIAAVPAALVLVAGPIAAIAAGMDGIKAAAQTLKPEFDALKAAVSATFEQGLRPAFETLRSVMPTVQQGLVGIAESLSGAAQRAANFLASSQGIALLEGIFGNIRTAIDGMLPGLGRIGTAFLTMANQRFAFDALTTAVNAFGTEFQNSVTRLIDDGVLQRAFSGLGGTLREIGRGFVYLVENGLRAFASAAPGVNSFLGSLTDFFNRFDWNSLGESVGGVFRGLGEALDGVPTSTFREIEGAFADLSATFQSADFQADLQNMIGAIPEAIGLIEDLTTTFGNIGAGIADGIEWFSRANESVSGFLENLGQKAEDLGDATIPDSWRDKFQQFDRDIQGWFENLIGLEPKAGEAAAGVKDSWTNGISEMSPATTQEMGKVPPAAENALAPLGPLGLEAGVSVAEGLRRANSQIIAGVSTWALSVRLGIQKFGTAITTGMAGARTAMGTALTGVNSAIIAAVGTWALSVQLGLQRMATAVTVAMASVRTAMTTALIGVNSSIIAAVNTWALSVQLGMQRMVTAVTTAFIGIRAAVTVGLTGINSSIIAAVSIWALSVQLGLVRMVTAVTTGMVGVRTAVFAGLTTVNATIIAGVNIWALTMQLGMQRLATAVTTGFAQVRAAAFAGTTMVNSVLIAGTSVWATTVLLAMSRMASSVTSGFAQINAAVSAGMAQCNSAIIAGGSVWASSVRLALSSAVRAANSFTGQFRDAGANMGQALADGLNSKAGAVEAAASRLANAAAAAARAAAAIRSPSRVFIQLGNYIGLGLAIGMDRCRGKVIRSAEVMIRDVTSAAEQLYGAFDGAAFGSKWASDMTAGLAAADGSVGQIANAARNRAVSGEWRTIVSSHGVSDEIVAALQGWEVQIDRNGITKLVNKSNTRRNRRR